LKQLCIYLFSSSLVLGLIIGITLLIIGETTAGVDLTFEFGTFDGLWWILAVPVVALLVFVLLSPLSFFIHKRLSKSNTENVRSDS
jgi:hypothetical protein